MTTILTCAALAAATVLVAVYVAAQRHRLRVLEARIAAAKADLAALHTGPTVERTETLLTTWTSANSRCELSLQPHWIVAQRALRAHPGCFVEVTQSGKSFWRGCDEGALSSWISSMYNFAWTITGNCTTTMTRRIPAPPTEPTP